MVNITADIFNIYIRGVT